MKKLKELFGHSAILNIEFESKLVNWPKIGNKDAKSKQDFSDSPPQGEVAILHFSNLNISIRRNRKFKWKNSLLVSKV